MLGSIRIGSLFGIGVRLHWLFIALVVILVWAGESPLWTGLSFGILFGIVLLHEFGHCLVAQRFGIQVIDITLWPLGGMARMSEIPEKPKVEALVAIAGPAVNFALAAVGFAVAALIGLRAAFSPSGLEQVTRLDWSAQLLVYFIFANLLLGFFNLLPAFPMDGGRVLRALLGAAVDWVRATEIAVIVGRVFAVLLIVGGIYGFKVFGPVMPLIGVFVWWAGARELWAVRLRHGRIPFGPFAGRPIPGMPGFASAAPAPAAPVPPAASHSRESPDPQTGARRPSAQWSAPELGRGRLSDEEIERLERFRGRLSDRPDPPDA